VGSLSVQRLASLAHLPQPAALREFAWGLNGIALVVGFIAALLFAVVALQNFRGRALTLLSHPLPFFAYPFLAAGCIGWAWVHYRNAASLRGSVRHPGVARRLSAMAVAGPDKVARRDLEQAPPVWKEETMATVLARWCLYCLRTEARAVGLHALAGARRFGRSVEGIAMKALCHFILALGALLALTKAALAEPIESRVGQCYAAQWVQAKETDCDRVCRRVDMSPESITLSAASTQRIFVCRHMGHRSNSFGEQGSGNCRILDGGTPQKRRKYECLCVRSGCKNAESRPRPGRRPADDAATRQMPWEECVARVQRAAAQRSVRLDRESYAKVKHHCVNGDLRGAMDVIPEGR